MINNIYQLVEPKNITIKYEEIELNEGLIIKPLYMSICHADQRYYLGTRDIKILKKKLPMALIHECCGEVVRDSKNIFKQGQKVALIPNIPGKFNEEIYENYSEGSQFLSSGIDGFMKEYILIKHDRVVPFERIPLDIAAIIEFISVGVHAVERFKAISHSNKNIIGIWGDGSLAFITANILKIEFPDSKIVIIGKNNQKLRHFSFVDETYVFEELPNLFYVDHAIECVGGDGSEIAIENIIQRIKPQGTVILMGVSENRPSINTRDILEKGLSLIGSSRSGYRDFKKTIELLENISLQNRLKTIIFDAGTVSTIKELHDIFGVDLNTEFKTVFKWGM